MGTRNYGWGSRDMASAARIALEATEKSFGTVDTVTRNFEQFKAFCKEKGVGRMERITPELVQEYGRGLADKVDNEEMTAGYAQNLVSSVNSAMNAATRGEWKSVSPTKECLIPQRSNVRTEPTVPRAEATKAINELNDRQAAIAQLAQDLGLRSKEASLIDAKSVLAQAENQGKVTITDGTKGGREREIPITHERQIESLRAAAAVQGNDRSMIPTEQSWKGFRAGELRDARESLQAATGGGLHDLRAAYACERYESLTGHPAPVNGGTIEDKQLDREAREQIASELGHGRIDVVSAYVGGR